MNMESKEKWIEKVLDSGTSIETTTHQPFLFRKTMNRIEHGTLKSTRSWWSKPVLASMFLLVVANCFTIYNLDTNNNSDYATNITSSENVTKDIASILNDYALQEAEATIYNF